MLSSALDSGFHMPPEWAPHERCWMAWPARDSLWGDSLAPAQRGYAAVAHAISEFEPVAMLTPPRALEQAESLCGDNVEIIPADLDDSWTRDTGPNFVVNEKGELAASIFHFNGWGKKYEQFGKDAALGHRLAEYLDIRTFSSPIYMEGGGINVDGEGTILTTESCVLNANRNPGITKGRAEEELCRALGAEKVIWLPGDPYDQETDGHVDGTACFVRPGVVLLELCPEQDAKRHATLLENLHALEGVQDAMGREIEIIQMEEAFEAEARSEIYCSSYVNFYIANGGIVMPSYGIPRDQEAREIVQNAFSDRKVVQVPIDDVAIGGGGIHCITQQQPRVV